MHSVRSFFQVTNVEKWTKKDYSYSGRKWHIVDHSVQSYYKHCHCTDKSAKRAKNAMLFAVCQT